MIVCAPLAQVDLDGTVVAQTAGGESSSSSDSDSDGEDADMHVEGAPGAEEQPAKAPVIDEEGFELVQKRRPRKGAPG